MWSLSSTIRMRLKTWECWLIDYNLKLDPRPRDLLHPFCFLGVDGEFRVLRSEGRGMGHLPPNGSILEPQSAFRMKWYACLLFSSGTRGRCRQTAGEATRAVNKGAILRKCICSACSSQSRHPLGMFLNCLSAASQSATGMEWLAVHTSGSILELEGFLDITRWRFTKSHCGTWNIVGRYSTQGDFRWGHINIGCTLTLNGFSKFYQSFWLGERENICLGLVDFYAH